MAYPLGSFLGFALAIGFILFVLQTLVTISPLAIAIPVLAVVVLGVIYTASTGLPHDTHERFADFLGMLAAVSLILAILMIAAMGYAVNLVP